MSPSDAALRLTCSHNICEHAERERERELFQGALQRAGPSLGEGEAKVTGGFLEEATSRLFSRMSRSGSSSPKEEGENCRQRADGQRWDTVFGKHSGKY